MDTKNLEPVLEKQLKGHRKSITSLCFSPNESHIASGSLDNSILLWDLRGTIKSYRFQGHDEAVMDVSFSPNGKFMASASRDRTVRIWVPSVTGSTGMFKAHSQTVRSVQFSPDNSKILTASDDKIVKLWSSDKHKFICSFVGHNNWVRCARMSNDGSVIASCSDDNTVKLWNLDDGKCIYTYKDAKGCGMYLAWHPSGCHVAVGTSQGNVKIYDIRTHNLLQFYSIHSETVNQLAVHPSGRYTLTCSKDGKMKVLDLIEGHPLFNVNGHTGSVASVTFSPSGNTFASAGDDKVVLIWKTNFTELEIEDDENQPEENPLPRTQSQTSRTNDKAVVDKWRKCYHNTKYPVSTFVHLDDILQSPVTSLPHVNNTFVREEQIANISLTPSNFNNNSTIKSLPEKKTSTPKKFNLPSFKMGATSHIPRTPPTPTNVTVPSIHSNHSNSKSDEEEMFGMISLKENDVCYTSGTIEWVGRKRSFPINSGFKKVDEGQKKFMSAKKSRRDETVTLGEGKHCECADVLPTVNAIVDHLNALHEAVDLVDLRLHSLEEIK